MSNFGKIVSGGLHTAKNILASTATSCDALVTSSLLLRENTKDNEDKENCLNAATNLAEISAYASLGLLGVSAVSIVVDALIKHKQKKEEELKKKEEENNLNEKFTKEMQERFDKLLAKLKDVK